MTADARPLVAVAQYAPVFGDAAANAALSLAWIERAADAGAGLVVLPECSLTGLAFSDRATLRAHAEPLEGPGVTAWRDAAARRGIHIVAGFAESAGDRLFNTAVLVTPEGDVATYRKTHLFGNECGLFDLGDRLVCADTCWGRVGLAICYDLWFPEVARALALAGASLVAAPSNWFTPPRQADEAGAQVPMAFHLATAAACSNELTIACADRIGAENGVRFLGGSFVLGPNGRPIAGPAAGDGEALLLATWPDPEATRRKVQSHLATRRVELYARPVAVATTAREGESG
ncbi:nitrilase-related carbon-nitrogen hydrolase [Ancylobacter terrae]|uniref:nitrilase-related carbon-nitrogen hydrolase n=1 Tax=Ancylobacter sp. sgz301288 TaxID=3342077 RepID=UPI003859BB4F